MSASLAIFLGFIVGIGFLYLFLRAGSPILHQEEIDIPCLTRVPEIFDGNRGEVRYLRKVPTAVAGIWVLVEESGALVPAHIEQIYKWRGERLEAEEIWYIYVQKKREVPRSRLRELGSEWEPSGSLDPAPALLRVMHRTNLPPSTCYLWWKSCRRRTTYHSWLHRLFEKIWHEYEHEIVFYADAQA